MQYNYGGTYYYLEYDLYTDSARTIPISSMPDGSFTWTHVITTAYKTDSNIAQFIYARAFAPSGTIPAGTYEAWGLTGTVRYAWSNSGYPATCTSSGGGTGSFTLSQGGNTTATYADTCAISTATDLNFGNVAALASNQDQVSTITLRCPSGTAWKLGLDNGSNASGTTRRMNNGSNYLTYELYRDSGRTQRWGNTVGTNTTAGTGSGSAQTQTVYGRVPAQTVPAAGTYSDTVTVTLTF